MNGVFFKIQAIYVDKSFRLKVIFVSEKVERGWLYLCYTLQNHYGIEILFRSSTFWTLGSDKYIQHVEDLNTQALNTDFVFIG